MSLPVCSFSFFAWIPASFALAYGSISFMLLDHNVVAWSLSARFSLLLAWAGLFYAPACMTTREVASFLGLLVLSGFLLFDAIPSEWVRLAQCLYLCIASGLAFFLTFFRVDATELLNPSAKRLLMCFYGHMIFLFYLILPIGE